MDKDTKRLMKELARQGFSIRTTKKGHSMVFGPDGKSVTTFAGTPSDRRSWLNSLAPLKRAGFLWPPKK